MLEIIEYIINKLKDDNSLSELLGSSISDPRIYEWLPPFKIQFSRIEKAAIFYRNNENPRPTEFSYPSQIGNIYFYFQIVSYNKTLTKQIVQLMEDILCPVDNSGFDTLLYKVGVVKNNGSSDGNSIESIIRDNPTNVLYVRNFSILLKEVFRRQFYSSP